MPDALFPAEAPARSATRTSALRGMKGYNGVAILSRIPLEPLHDGARLVRQGRLPAPRRACSTCRAARSSCTISTCRPAATCRIARSTRSSPTSSISWPRRRDWFAARPALARAVLVGDLNIAPLEHDVWSHKQLLDVVSHTPAETEGLTAWQNDRLHRRGAAFRAGGRKAVHLVVVPQPGLARLQPWPPARPYLGHADLRANCVARPS